MEKTIKLNGQDLVLEARAMNGTIYEAQFGEDPLPVMWAYADVLRGEAKVQDIGMMPMARLTWAMAKTKDPDFPDFKKWIEGLEAFPVIEVYNQTAELVFTNLVTKSPIQPKNADGTED